MKVVSVINYKGGVGKTTVTANLAAGLAKKGKRVLLLDVDAQASLTFSFIKPDIWDENYKENHTIKQYFDAVVEGKTPPPLKDFLVQLRTIKNTIKKSDSYSYGGSVDLIPSHLGLINIDLELAKLLYKNDDKEPSKDNYLDVHGSLMEFLKKYARKNYDVVLIDCPPNFNIVTKNALIASDQILIPAKPDYLSTLGIDYLRKSITELIAQFNENAGMQKYAKQLNPTLGVIFTMVSVNMGKPIRTQSQYITQVKNQNIQVFKSYFRENKTLFPQASEDGKPVILHQYKTGTAHNIVQEVSDFVDEFQKFLGS